MISSRPMTGRHDRGFGGDVEEAVDISEATAAETETASATAEEQAASMSQVSASIESLADQSERLQTMLSEFEVGSR